MLKEDKKNYTCFRLDSDTQIKTTMCTFIRTVYYLTRVQHSAGKLWILTFMWLATDIHHPNSLLCFLCASTVLRDRKGEGAHEHARETEKEILHMYESKNTEEVETNVIPERVTKTVGIQPCRLHPER